MCTALAARAGGTMAADSAAVALAMADCFRCPCRAAAIHLVAPRVARSFRKIRTVWVKRTDVSWFSFLRAHANEGKPLPSPLHNYYLYHCIAYVQCSGARSAQASELRLHRSDLSHRCRTPLQGRASVEASSPCHASASAEAHLVRVLLRTGIRLEVRIVG